jgi:hypothetical protein
MSNKIRIECPLCSTKVTLVTKVAADTYECPVCEGHIRLERAEKKVRQRRSGVVLDGQIYGVSRRGEGDIDGPKGAALPLARPKAKVELGGKEGVGAEADESWEEVGEELATAGELEENREGEREEVGLEEEAEPAEVPVARGVAVVRMPVVDVEEEGARWEDEEKEFEDEEEVVRGKSVGRGRHHGADGGFEARDDDETRGRRVRKRRRRKLLMASGILVLCLGGIVITVVLALQHALRRDDLAARAGEDPWLVQLPAESAEGTLSTPRVDVPRADLERFDAAGAAPRIEAPQLVEERPVVVATPAIPGGAGAMRAAGEIDEETRMERIIVAAEGFLNAASVAERAGFVRNREVAYPRMAAHYAERGDEPYRYRGISPRVHEVMGRDFVGLQVDFEDGEQRMLGMEWVGDRYLVDWESFVIWQEMGWEEFVSTRETAAQAFRVVASRDQYFNYSFGDRESLLCFRLQNPLDAGAAPLYGYTAVGSPVAVELERLELLGGGSALPVVVKLRFPSETRGGGPNQVWIQELVSDGWLIRPR